MKTECKYTYQEIDAAFKRVLAEKPHISYFISDYEQVKAIGIARLNKESIENLENDSDIDTRTSEKD